LYFPAILDVSGVGGLLSHSLLYGVAPYASNGLMNWATYRATGADAGGRGEREERDATASSAMQSRHDAMVRVFAGRDARVKTRGFLVPRFQPGIHCSAPFPPPPFCVRGSSATANRYQANVFGAVSLLSPPFRSGSCSSHIYTSGGGSPARLNWAFFRRS